MLRKRKRFSALDKIDYAKKRLYDGRLVQKLSPRRKGSHWSNLNFQRCYELERRGLMTDAGRATYRVLYYNI